MGFNIISIDHIQVAAPPNHEESARTFYGETLGLEEVEKPTSLQRRGGCWFQIGAQQLHVGTQEDFTPSKKAHPAFVVKDLTELRNNLQRKGIEIKPDTPIDGRERFFVKDPFGNRIEFLEYLT